MQPRAVLGAQVRDRADVVERAQRVVPSVATTVPTPPAASRAASASRSIRPRSSCAIASCGDPSTPHMRACV